MDTAKYRESFVLEAKEHVQSLNQHLLKLEVEPGTKEHLDALFRAAHTLKGMAATMGYQKVTKLSKGLEETLGKIRKGDVSLNKALSDSLFRCFDALEEMVDNEDKDLDLDAILHALERPSQTLSESPAEPGHAAILPATIHVQASDLDSLVNLSGELVISLMRLEQLLSDGTPEEERQAVLSVGRLVLELQSQTMKVRLVPLEQVFSRFPRMVRDIARSLGKEVKLETEGLGIEVDRTVLRALTDPVLHLLRNAIDHGIETPGEREASGKARAGTIGLVASRVGNKVEIRVRDDGRGIDLDRIRAAASAKGFVNEGEGGPIEQETLLGLLGTPGLTAATAVTDISGRGVGMNVARSGVKEVGGSMGIKTAKGRGTEITLTVPISLAIVQGLLVSVEGETYALPLSSIKSVLSLNDEEIKQVHGREAIILQQQFVPLIKISDVLGLGGSGGPDRPEKATIIIVEDGGKIQGLVVDSVEGQRQIVVKKLKMPTPVADAFSSATILPDGKVVLILDPQQLHR